ncbi:unnamed protein product [Parnassius mnemosyne]|uniref:Reverse transcriptase domain-containing protein n=1 Tax=Parnassius mnemosyne TaxID=213953 RepID=A0AAV1KSL3_9NEOP
MGDIKVNCLLYADDAVLIAPSEAELQALVTCMKEECEIKGLRLNANKTKFLVFERDEERTKSRLSDVTCPNITNEIDEKDEDESSELETEVTVSAGKDDVDTEHVADTQCPSETVPDPATPQQPPPPSRPVTRSRRIRKPVIKFQC